MHTARRPTHLKHRAAWLLAVLVAVLLAQTLGLVHGVLHADPAHHKHHAHQDAHHDAQRDTHHGVQAHSVDDLFGDHDDESQCRLYDQVAHADLAFGVLLLPMTGGAPAQSVATHPTWHLAAQAAGFLARGPPALG